MMTMPRLLRLRLMLTLGNMVTIINGAHLAGEHPEFKRNTEGLGVEEGSVATRNS